MKRGVGSNQPRLHKRHIMSDFGQKKVELKMAVQAQRLVETYVKAMATGIKNKLEQKSTKVINM